MIDSSDIVPVVASGLTATGAVIAAIISAMALRQTTRTHHLINSRMDELLELTRLESRAEGLIEGRAEGVLEGKVEGVLAGKAVGTVIEVKANGVAEGATNGTVEIVSHGAAEGKLGTL